MKLKSLIHVLLFSISLIQYLHNTHCPWKQRISIFKTCSEAEIWPNLY